MRFRKKQIFLSYSKYRNNEADLIEKYFCQNGIKIVRDVNEKNSFLHFMDQLENCDGVIFLLNNTFFESVFCTYEMLIWAKEDMPATAVHMSYLDIKQEEVQREAYNSFVNNIYILSDEQRRKISNIIADYNEYNKAINKLLNLCEIKWDDDISYEEICLNIYKKIVGKPSRKRHIKNLNEIMNSHSKGLEKIKDDNLKSEFFEFLSDMVRCSSFYMSIYPEDSAGEEEFRLEKYDINYGQIGASIRIEALDGQNRYRKIEVFDIVKIERNTSDFGPKHIKYYFVIRDRNLYRDYTKQVNLREELQNKAIIDKYLSCGVNRQRCTLIFKDGDALSSALFDEKQIINFIED